MSGLHLIAGNRTEDLVAELADTLRGRVDRPLRPEWILIQGRGMERYLALQLARRLGVAANIRFPYPGRFIEGLVAAVVGDNRALPLDLRRLSLRLAAVLPDQLRQPEFARVKDYLEAGDDRRLFTFARQMADIYDQYLVHRPELLSAWTAGNDAGLGVDDRWQPLLWREVVRTLAVGDPQAALELLREQFADPRYRATTLPPRLFLFGVSTVRGLHRRVLLELARATEVHVFHLCAGKRREKPAAEDGVGLLERLSVVADEFHGFLRETCAATGGSYRERFTEPGVTTSLSRLQRRLFQGEPAPADTQSGPSSADGPSLPEEHSGIRLVSCHTPFREVEALRDHLLATFERTPDLGPSDVLVLTPDIAMYAPLVDAVFGTPETPQCAIPYHVADSRPGEGAELIETLVALFEVAAGRLTARQVLQLLEEHPLAAHFGLEEAEQEWVRAWLRETGIRWGYDASDRVGLGLPEFAEGSWQSGLDRLLLGIALSSDTDEHFGGVRPLGPVEKDGQEILGSLVELVSELHRLSAELRRARPINEWALLVRDVLLRFCGHEVEAAPALRDLLREWELAPLRDGLVGSFGFEAFAAQIAALPLEVSAGVGFASGGVLFAALLPMRSVPYRMVCLLGMNEDAFPGQDLVPEFHLLYRENDPELPARRSDDRLLFLETLLSARDELYISYVGQDMYTNRERHPSVVVAEMLEALCAWEDRPREDFVLRHRLQSFAPVYFRGDSESYFSYSERQADAARALLAGRREAPAFSLVQLPPLPRTDFPTLEELQEFFQAPGRYFLQKRFGFSPRPTAEAPAEEEDLVLDNLGNWRLIDFLIDQLSNGRPEQELLRRARAAGLLPPGTVGELAFENQVLRARVFVAQLQTVLPTGQSEFLDAEVELGEAFLSGRLRLVGGRLVLRRTGRLRGQDQLNAWLQHLFLQLLPEGVCADRRTLAIGQEADTLRLDVAEYGPVPHAEAAGLLTKLTEVYRRGLLEPLPLFPRTSFEFARERLIKGEQSALYLARRLFSSGPFNRDAEDANPWVELCFRGRDPLGDPADDFRDLAMLVYAPLLEARRSVAVPEVPFVV